MTRRPAVPGRRSIVVAAVAVIVIGVAFFLTQTNSGRHVRELATGPSANLTASPLVAPITLGDYLARYRGATIVPYVADRIRRQSGHRVIYTITDFAPRAADRCELVWTELDRRDNPAEESFWRYDTVRGWPDGLLLPTDAAHRVSGELWVPLPNALLDVGWFAIRLQVRCADQNQDPDQEIARFVTEEFRVDVPPVVPRAVATPLS